MRVDIVIESEAVYRDKNLIIENSHHEINLFLRVEDVLVHVVGFSRNYVVQFDSIFLIEAQVENFGDLDKQLNIVRAVNFLQRYFSNLIWLQLNLLDVSRSFHNILNLRQIHDLPIEIALKKSSLVKLFRHDFFRILT